MKIALFLDVDGVLNQYRISERIKRYKKHERKGFSEETDCFNPFQKKVLRLNKLIKKYKIDVIVFSAWTEKDLQSHLPFNLKGDASKWISDVNFYAKQYDKCLLIDDEISSILERGCKGEKIKFENNIIFYQPNSDFGLVLKDFKKIENILKGI